MSAASGWSWGRRGPSVQRQTWLNFLFLWLLWVPPRLHSPLMLPCTRGCREAVMFPFHPQPSCVQRHPHGEGGSPHTSVPCLSLGATGPSRSTWAVPAVQHPAPPGMPQLPCEVISWMDSRKHPECGVCQLLLTVSPSDPTFWIEAPPPRLSPHFMLK